MLIARVQTVQGDRHVRMDGGGDRWVPIEDPYAAFEAGSAPADAAPADAADDDFGDLLAPAVPSVVVGIAQNGPDHHSPVQAWLKSPRTVTASGIAVTLRRDAGTAVAEGEIAVVIGKTTTGLTAQNAHEYVLGITAVNDLSSPDRGAWDPRNFESKSGEGYTPLGPWIDTSVGIDDVELTLEIDGIAVVETGSHDLPASIRECLAYVAAWSTLGPGDVVMTGAPRAQAQVTAGQTVTVRVAGMALITPTV